MSTSLARAPRALVGQEHGLVTVVVNPAMRAAAKRPRRGARVRLLVPLPLLRDDWHVLDVDAALDFVQRTVLAAVRKSKLGCEWTEVVIGGARVTIGFSVSTKLAEEMLPIVIQGAKLEPWGFEEVAPEPSMRRRLAALVALALPDPSSRSGRATARERQLAKALAAVRVSGSFRERAGLGEALLDRARVEDALRWLSSRLEATDPLVLRVLGRDLRPRISLEVNAHPQRREVGFILESATELDVEEYVPLSTTAQDALRKVFDVPADETRRLAGLFWGDDRFAVKGAPRIRIDAFT